MNRNTFRLEDLAAKGRSIISGPFGSSIGSRFFQSDGVPVIRGNNLTTDHKKFVEQGFAFVSHEKAEELNAYALRDDILFTAAGTIGQVGIIPRNSRFEKYVISNKQLRIRIDAEKADPDFVFYWLASPWIFETIQNRNTGSTVPLINLGTIRGLPVVLPGGVEDQKKVSALLGAIDAKIELNNRINAELEGMAKLLYDYWFVQFDFPMTAAQATALGKPHLTGHPYRASGGKMIYNETLKRDIPEGWVVTTLSKFANITMGQSPPGESYNQEGSGLVFFQGSTDFGWRYPQVREFTTAPSRLAKAGDILLSVRAPVGTLKIADQACCIGRGLAALNAKSGHDAFLFEVMLYFKTIFDRRNASGTTFGSITKDDLHSLEFACPSTGSLLLDAFEEKMKPVYKAILNNHQQNQELTQLRDWLLPMLMNGQVTVGTNER